MVLKHDVCENIPATLGNQGSTITCAATDGSLTAEGFTVLSKTTLSFSALKMWFTFTGLGFK
jgi:hypothetical protein